MKQFYARTTAYFLCNKKFTARFCSMVLPGILFSLIFIDAHAQGEPFTKRVVANGFTSAWEVVVGPNDSLWVTDNRAYTITRVRAAGLNQKTILVNIKTSDPAINLPATGGQAQGGLMGLALHPNLYSTDPAVRAAKPWVYAAYVYTRGFCPGSNTMCYFTTKIVRYTYSGNTLTSPVTVLDNIPGSSDHNSGRLVMSPIIEPGADAAHTQYRLYYTIGDMGAGQFLNTTRPQNALNMDTLSGKIIRLNTESDGDAGLDAWIPNDNPFFEASTIEARDYIYSYGHRNAQGLAWGKVSTSGYYLYITEQMDKTDDEINMIWKGKNYGWDSTSGYAEGNTNGYKIGQTVNPNEQNYAADHPEFVEPIFTAYTATAAQHPLPASNSLWPTIALSSIDFYGLSKIPGWRHSLLITGLKRDKVYRLKLNTVAEDVIGDTIPYFAGDGSRIRRVTVHPNGTKFYVARDAGASANPGSIMEYTYAGVTLALPDQPGVEPEEKDEVDMFPNPVKDIITIKGKKNLYKPLRVQFFDISGVMVKEETSLKNEFNVNIAHFKPGMYVVKLYNGYNVEVKVEKIYKK